ncbi:hypothetical protein D3C80_1937870 [compost metagenome]
MHRQVRQQRKHLDARAAGLFDRITDHRVIQRHDPHHIHALAQLRNGGGGIAYRADIMKNELRRMGQIAVRRGLFQQAFR